MKFVIVLLLVGIATVSCIPKRGGKIGDEGGKGGRKGSMRPKPCKGWDNVGTCECTDGDTYDNKDDVKENCGKKNPLVSCTCTNGDVWTKPEKEDRPTRGGGKKGNGGKGNGGGKEDGGENENEEETKSGKGGRPAKKNTPCGKWKKVKSCVCEDGETYERKAAKKECKKDNRRVSCTCKNGDVWTKPEKEDRLTRGGGKKGNGGKGNGGGKEDGGENENEEETRPGKGGRPAKKNTPCGKWKKVKSCVCEDGETYEGRAAKKSCKKDDNPVVQCTCKKGKEWTDEE